MSQVVKRKSAAGDEKEKRQSDSPVKDMKKKLAANAEKEKMAAEKTDKNGDRVPEKKEKANEKKQAYPKTQTPEKKDKTDKAQDKKDKPQEKKGEKKTEPEKEKEKKEAEPKAEKSNAKEDKPKVVATNRNSKPETNSKQNGISKPETNSKENGNSKPSGNSKQNGNSKVHNGVSDVTLSANGTGDDLLHEVASSDSEGAATTEQPEVDELFPELAYDDGSDGEGFEVPTPDSLRSATRRSQVKSARTPETPRPRSARLIDDALSKTAETAEPILMHALQVAVQVHEVNEITDCPKESKMLKLTTESGRVLRSSQAESQGHDVRPEEAKGTVEVIVEEVEVQECDSRKPDTNFSKTRVKVSPYRARPEADCSTLANYTGNNTTMEMDITSMSVGSTPDRSFAATVRGMRGRRSYKDLGELPLRHRLRSADRIAVPTEPAARPTGTVVGRKRKPDEPEVAEEALETSGDATGSVEAKRMRLLDRVFRVVRRAPAPIVGINSDLPLTAPVAPPEALTAGKTEVDGRRCAIM